MPVLVEMLDRGLCNTKDRSLLAPGQLARANNCFYKPFDPALHKHPGRAEYNSSAAAATVRGLKYVEFDNVVSKLVEYFVTAGVGKLAISDFIAETGTFSTFTPDIGVGDHLDSVYYQDKYILLVGAATPSGALIGNNLTLLSSGVLRRHGLAPVVSPPDPGPAVIGVSGSGTVAGSWPDTTEFPLGWYFFITTEVTDESESGDFLESAWEGETMLAVKVDNIALSVQIDFPAVVNTGDYSSGQDLIAARRVYMAGPIGEIDPIQTGQPPNPPLSAFRLVAQVPVGTETTIIGATSLTNASLPTVSGGTFTGTADALTDNNVGAQATATGQTLLLSTFGLAAPSTVTGFRVEMKMRYTGVPVSVVLAPEIVIGLSKDAGATVHGATKTVKAQSNYFVTYDRGGFGGDLWGGTWSMAEVTSANFGVRIVCNMPGGASSPPIQVDVVRIQVFTASGVTDIPLGQDFPYVAIPVGGGTAALYPSHSQPPIASTGDVFEGQVVVNDVERPGEIAYSLPDFPEYFPSPYRIKFPPKLRDEVTCVRKLGDVLLVGMFKQLYAVHKLPREEDPFFDPTRIYTRIAPDRGVVNPNAIVIVSSPGQPELGVFVSHNGIHYTDGMRTDTILGSINWHDTVNTSKLDKCWLIDYPKHSYLVFGYIPAGDEVSTTATKRLILHYHPSHIEGGKFIVTGPIDLDGTIADLAWLDDQPLMVAASDDNRIYVEDRGWVDEANADANLIMSILTRDMYPAGVGYEATLERVWWRRAKYDAPEITLTVQPWIKKTGGDYITPADGQRWTAKTRSALTGAPLVGDIATVNNAGVLERTDQHAIHESFALQAETSDTPNGYALSYFAMQVEGKGQSDNP